MELIKSVLTKHTRYQSILLLGLIVILFTKCNTGDLDFDNIETPLYTPTVIAPLGQTTYTIETLIAKLEDSTLLVSTDNSNLLSIAYRDTTLFDDYSSIIQLQDISNPGTIDASLTPIFGSPSNQDVAIPAQNLSFEYASPNNEELDSIIYTAGTITLNIQNGYTSALVYELSLDDVVDVSTGDPMVMSGTLPANGSDNVFESLVGYKTVLTQVADKNIFTGVFNGTLKVKTGDFVIGTEQINYTLAISGADFSEIYGWFGDKTLDIGNQSFDMAFFEGISENSLFFNNPQLNFYVNNSFGVPMGLNLGGISSSNANGTSVNLSGTVTAEPQFIRAPSTSRVGTITTSVVEVDNSNSNLQDLLAISPNQFNIVVSANSNYNNLDKEDRNFVSKESQAEVITELNVPFNVKLIGATRSFPTGIAGFDFDDADTLKLVINSTNQLPFDATVDLQLWDADSVVSFEEKDVLFMTSPEVPITGKIEEPVVSTDTVTIYKGYGYEQLLEASVLNLVMRVTSINAAEDTYVKIFSDYEVILQVGVEVSVNYEL